MNRPFKQVQLQKLGIGVRSSLWFVPALLIIGAVALALGLIELDQRFGQVIKQRWPWMLSSQADGAQNMLSAIASSMITVAGVVFSITIVALAMASTQYSPRVLRNFMRDRVTQVVLGLFVGVFVYCLLVLRVTQGGSQSFIPSLAILGALLLTLTACGFFIYFIHHISNGIQASTIIDAITRETCGVISTVFPDTLDHDTDARPEQPPPLRAGQAWHPLPARAMGYLQTVDIDCLKQFACKHNTFAQMEFGTGDFIAPDAALVKLALAEPPDQDTIDEINAMFAIARVRTIEQDPAFGVRQLVDVALKALSPGINDTTTAVTAVEHLSVLLSHCVGRYKHAPGHDQHGALRVLWRGPSFDILVALAYSQTLESARANLTVLLSIIKSIEHIGRGTRHRQRQVELHKWLCMVAEAAIACAKTDYARRQVGTARAAALDALRSRPNPAA